MVKVSEIYTIQAHVHVSLPCFDFIGIKKKWLNKSNKRFFGLF